MTVQGIAHITPITGSQVDISIDESIDEDFDESINEDHDPIIVILPDPQSKAAESDEDNTEANTNNEVNCQENNEEIIIRKGGSVDGSEEPDSLLDHSQITTRSKNCSDNDHVTVVELQT